ncbi:MAG: phytase [Rhodanobacter sp.]
MKTGFLYAAVTSLAMTLAGCAPAAHETASAPAPASVPARMQTQATASGKTDFGVLVTADGPSASSRIVATAALGGLEVYGLDGKRQASVAAGETAGIDVSYGFPLGGKPTTVLTAVDATGNSLRLFTMDGDKPVEAGARAIPLGFAVEGVCLFRSRLDNALYAIVVGDGGEVDQQMIYATDGGKLDARQVRRVSLPSKLKQCAADSDGNIYVAEQAVGIWHLDGNPEADLSATLVDAPRLGHLGKKVEGVALYDGGKGSQWLLVSDTSKGRINVYDRANHDAWLGSFGVSAEGKPVEGPGPLFATSAALGSAYPHGVLLVSDEDGGADHKAVSMADVAGALKLQPGTPQDPRASARPPLATVTALVETVPVASFGDAADDPAIWANPADPAKSLIVATDKKAGMAVYDMQGKLLQFRPDGKMNNTDLREDFPLGGKKVVLVTASDRTHKSVAIYRLDTGKRELVDVADGVQATGLDDPYGLCMYRSPKSAKTYVFINTGDGLMRQWELLDAGNGRVRIKQVREFRMASQAEGCVADDIGGALYVDEEDVAVWKMNPEPDGGDAMTAIDRVADNKAVKDDLEGVGMYDLSGGRGYIVVSSQGNDTYAVYRRDGDHAYLGSFAVVADGARGIDGISETDGLEISSRNLGPGFEHGAMIAQDGRNVLPSQNQNYKYVPWESIARALKLEMR